MNHIYAILIAVCFLNVACFVPFEQSDAKKCGYQSCHQVSPEKLNVHLIPHSHDDVGWVETVDTYFNGYGCWDTLCSVNNIIGSVVASLLKNPDRRFIQVETAYFWMWWQKQTEIAKSKVRNLVNEGRLEIVNGAWAMNDEAASHYQSIIDQFTWGLRIINDTVGECGQPKIGWQIDPFGHSREMASLFSQLGYEAMFFWRLDYRDGARRRKTGNLDMIWQGSPSLGNKSNIFASILYRSYNAPKGFCWDYVCSDELIYDNRRSPRYNVEYIVHRFAKYVLNERKGVKTNNILIPMGGDFTYNNATKYFINMDKLIKGFKKFRPEINVIYSTPSCYIHAVNKASTRGNVFYETKFDDFFPYADSSNSYWTGYFTSRPNSKRFERQGNNILQVAKQLITFENLLNNKDFSSDIILLKQAMGIMQHHDAITGTEKQHVVNDYVRILDNAIEVAGKNMGQIIADIVSKTNDVNQSVLHIKSCLMTNVSYCPGSSADSFAVFVYNPLSKFVSHHIHLPVNEDEFTITDINAKSLEYDVLPIMKNYTLLPHLRQSNKNLIFLAEDIPAFGLKAFYIQRENTGHQPIKNSLKYNFGTKDNGFEIDSSSGLLKSVTLNEVTIMVSQTFMYYYGHQGYYTFNDRPSGAYIFRPSNNFPNAIPITDKVKVTMYRGNLVDEVHQEFNSWIKQIIRLYKNENYIEFDWSVGPIHINPSSDLGVEVISRFSTNIASDGVFYTDANGRQMIKRVRNYRETYKYTNEEPVAGNYYPVTSRIAIRDLKRNIEMTLLNDRAQGGSSLKDGDFELMVHRRSLSDDNLGVGEALNEYEFGKPVVARGQHYLLLGSMTTSNTALKSAVMQRYLSQKKLLRPWIFIANATSSNITNSNLQNKLKGFSGLKEKLPDNVQILTLEPWKERSFLLRLEHIFEMDEDEKLSKPVEINLKDLLISTNIIAVEETTLGANQWIGDNQKLKWNAKPIKSADHFKKVPGEGMKNNFKFILNPMEIRTFIVHY